MVKFMKKGIKDGQGNYFPVWYSRGGRIDGSEGVTIYSKSYRSFSEEISKVIHVKNETDMRTDYFEKDRAFIPIESNLYKLIP